jgi:hypothetical protein
MWRRTVLYRWAEMQQPDILTMSHVVLIGMAPMKSRLPISTPQ